MVDIKVLEKLKQDYDRLGEKIELATDIQTRQDLLQAREAIELMVIALVLHPEQMELLS